MRFARFRVIDISLALIGLQVCRETAQIAKGWPSFRSSLSRSRSCGYLHQSTKHTWTLNPWCRRNAETRDLGLKTRGDRCGAGCRVSHVRGLNARGSVQCENPSYKPAVARLVVSLAARDQGTTCALLTVADKAGARSRTTVIAQWPCLIDFCCFRHHLNANGRPFLDHGRKLRKSIMRRKANGCAMSASTSSTLLHGQPNTVGQCYPQL